MPSEIQASNDRSADLAAQPKSSAPDGFAAKSPGSVVVLGMHRSGTSAVTRLLGISGLNVGDETALLPAHPSDNPTGYWERADLNAINDEILVSAGRAWNRVAGLNADSIAAAEVTNADERIDALISQFQASGRPWVIKDPRLCLTLPRWLPRLSNPACVVVVRDPQEVAASMASGPRGTFTSAFVIALWTKYMHAALEGLRGRRAVFVSYRAVLADAQGQCARIVNGLHELGVRRIVVPDSSEISEFIDCTRRRGEPPVHVALSPEQSRLYDWLNAQCGADHPVVGGFPQLIENDSVLREFEAAFDFHIEHGRANAIDLGAGRVGFDGDIAKPLREIGRLLAGHSREREEWRTQERTLLADARKAHARLHRTLVDNESVRRDGDAVRTQMRERDDEIVRLRTAADYASQQLDNLQERGAALTSHAAALQTTVDALRRSLSWKLTAPLRAIGSFFSVRPSSLPTD